MKSINIGSTKKGRVLLIALLIVVVLSLCAIVGFTRLANITNGKVLTYDLSEALGGVTTAKVDINPGDGNLTVDNVTDDEQVLANGSLQYLEKLGLPARSLDISNGQATLTLKAGATGQSWNRLPWEACNGATEWQIHLNPTVQSDIKAHSDGGNVRLNLAGLVITRVSADTGGGNVDVILPDQRFQPWRNCQNRCG